MRSYDILRFWFDELEPKDWFTKSDALDAKITEQFLPYYKAAVSGKLEDWKQTSEGCLAYIIVLDQFSRNIFRDSNKAFIQDEKALIATKHALAKGFHKELDGPKRTFLIMPLMHSEDLGDQQECVLLFREWGEGYENNLKYAKEHRDIIERFGRFPHRNEVLGRSSTPEEVAFNKEHGGF